MSVVLATSYRQGLLALIRSGMLAVRPFWVAGLFINDITPTPATVAEDFSVPTWTGYAPLPLTAWGLPYLNTDGNAEMAHAPLVYLAITPAEPVATVYGYFVVDGLGRLIWSDRLPSDPVPVVLPQQNIVLGVTLDLGQM
jgi:hypothetical protein